MVFFALSLAFAVTVALTVAAADCWLDAGLTSGKGVAYGSSAGRRTPPSWPLPVGRVQPSSDIAVLLLRSTAATPLSDASQYWLRQRPRRGEPVASSPQPRAVTGEPAFASLRCLSKNNNSLFPSLVGTSIFSRLRLQKFSLRVNHLRTEYASQILLRGVTRAGEGIMVSPAHLICPIGTSERGEARR